MEDMSSHSGDWIDINGRVVTDLKGDDGEVYVKLKDVEKAGFRLFQKKFFENTWLLDKEVRKDIEGRLFYYLRECVLEAERAFTENEVIDIFERVEAKLFKESEHRAEHIPACNRQISATREQPANNFAEVGRPEQESTNQQISNVSGTKNVRRVERMQLAKGSLIELKVTFLTTNRTFYAQLLEHVNKVQDILLHVNSEDFLLPVIENPEEDMLVVVQFEKLWYRGVVIRQGKTPGSALVELLDYGNTEKIKGNIRQMSEDMQKIPAQAIRFMLNISKTSNVPKLKIGQYIEIIVDKTFELVFEYEKTTYLVDINRILGSDEVYTLLVDNQPLKNFKLAAKCFMQIPKSNAGIVLGEMIFIISHTNNKLIVKNREMAELSKKISSLVASMNKEPVINPKVGQYVLCHLVDFGDRFFRAVIKKIHGKLASLKLIDFAIEERLPLRSLKNLDEALAHLPPASIEINYPPLQKITDEGLMLLSGLISEKIKIQSALVNGRMDFKVDGELLSKKITLKRTPLKSYAIPSPSHREPRVKNQQKKEPVCAKSVVKEEMQEIPAQSMACTRNVYSTSNVSKLEIDEDMKEVGNKQVENKETTYLVDNNQNLGSDAEVDRPLVENQPLEGVNPAPKPAAKWFMKIPKSTFEIVPGEKIFIVDHTDDNLIVKNGNMAVFTEKMSSLVASMQKEPLTDPKVGQYVLCNCVDFEDGFLRAIIKEIHGELASLKLIDFFGEKTLPLTSLKNIDEVLAYLPPAHIEIDYPPLKKVTEEGLTLLRELISGESEIESTKVNGLIDFRVDGELLSQKITVKPRLPKSDAILSPSPIVTKNAEPVKANSLVTEVKNNEVEKIFFRDMPLREPEAGLDLYSCFSYDGSSLTIVGISDENIQLIDKVTVAEPEDNLPYKPVQFEMCLVKYYDDSWCRCMAIGDDDEKVEVKFVDYGNIAKISTEDVRKLPEEMKTIPILGIKCQIEGIEISDAVEKRLKELIQDGVVLEVDVKDGRDAQNRMDYSVKLPTIYNLLKKEGLIN